MTYRNVGFNRKTYKPCFECKGTGKKDNSVCKKCAGYGSIALKVIMKRA